MNHRTKIL